MSRIHPFTRASIAGALIAFLLLWSTGVGESLEYWSLNLRFRLRSAPKDLAPVLMVVLRGERVRPPGRRIREDLADLLETLEGWSKDKRPKAVVVDIALTEAPGTSSADIPEAGERIVRASQELRNVVHAGIFTYREDEIRDPPRDVTPLARHSLPLDAHLPAARVARGIQMAHPSLVAPLYAAADFVGFISLSPLPNPGRGRSVYSFPMITRYKSEWGEASQQQARDYLALSLAGVATTLCGDIPLERCLRRDGVGLLVQGRESRRIPLDDAGLYFINYRKRYRFLQGGIAGEAASVGAKGAPEVVLYERPRDGQAGRLVHLDYTPIPSLDTLSDRVLLVVDGQERLASRSPLGYDYSQSAMHAQIISNILENDYLRRLPSYIAGLMVLVALAGIILWRVRTQAPANKKVEERNGFWLGLVYARSLLLAPEPSFVVLWCAVAGGLFVVRSIWVPVVFPCGVMVGSFLGWRFMLPRYLYGEVNRQKALAEERSRRFKDLEQDILALERARDEAVRAMTEAMSREQALAARERETIANDPVWTLSFEELQELDHVLEEAYETLARQGLLPGTSVLPEKNESSSSLLLERLGQGKSHVREAQSQLERIQEELREVEPTVDKYRRWYQTWAPAYQGLFKQLQGILNAAVDRVARLTPDLEPDAAPEELANLEPDPFLTERTGCLTCDPRMARILRDIIELYGPLDKAVLIQGETGTGKELIARAIHRNSPRAAGQPAAIVENCANLDVNLAKSRLFGHRKGAFSGADSAREGVFVEADGGTLVLDELGELPLEVQGMLLRVLEDQIVKPLGGSERHARKVDVRVIASTNADLEKDVEEGKFRRDLYHRLRRLPPIKLPPLRQRQGDVLLLTDFFFHRACEEYGRTCELSDDARQYLVFSHSWPGNVRELENVVTGLVAMARGAVIDVREVQEQLGPDRFVSPEPDVHQVFSLNELHLLRLQRREQFNMKACGDAPDYPGNRATADRHLRIFLSKGLWMCGWDSDAAAQLLAGKEQPELRPVIEIRLGRFVKNLEKRLEDASQGGDEGDLRRAIRREYSPHHEHVLRVLDAIRFGKLRSDFRHKN